MEFREKLKIIRGKKNSILLPTFRKSHKASFLSAVFYELYYVPYFILIMPQLLGVRHVNILHSNVSFPIQYNPFTEGCLSNKFLANKSSIGKVLWNQMRLAVGLGFWAVISLCFDFRSYDAWLYCFSWAPLNRCLCLLFEQFKACGTLNYLFSCCEVISNYFCH